MFDKLWKKPDGTPHAGKVAAWATVAAILVPFVAGFEGYALHPYVDRIGTGHPITCGYGMTGAECKNPPKTEAEARAALEKLLKNKYDPAILNCIHVYLPPYRRAMLDAAAYNLGPAAICKSAIAQNINAGNNAAGCAALLGYTHSAGKVRAGLVRRRQAEYKLCLRND